MDSADKLVLAMSDALEQLGELVKENAENTTKFHMSQNFKDHIVYKQETAFTATITSELPWSSYLEYGNPDDTFTIRPTKAKVLHFFVNGEEVFTKKAKAHEGYHYMEEASRVANNSIESVVAECIQNAFRK